MSQRITVTYLDEENPFFLCPLNGEEFLPQMIELFEGDARLQTQLFFYDQGFLHGEDESFPIRIGGFADVNGTTCAVLEQLPLYHLIRGLYPDPWTITANIRMERLDYYYYGVYAGGMTNDGRVTIKARVISSSAPGGFSSRGTLLRIAQRSCATGQWIEFTPDLLVGENPTEPGADGDFTWVVEGLNAGCEYNAYIGEPLFGNDFYNDIDAGTTDRLLYRAVQGGRSFDASFPARFVMPAPPTSKAPVRFAVMGDNSGGHVSTNMKGFAERRYDFYVHTGDWVYADFAPEYPDRRVALYNESYAGIMRNDVFARAMQSTGLLAFLPDDHEVVDGWQNSGIGAERPDLWLTNDEISCHLFGMLFQRSEYSPYRFFYDAGDAGASYLDDDIVVDAYNVMDSWVPRHANHLVTPTPYRNFSVVWGAAHLIVADRNPLVDQQQGTVDYHWASGDFFRPEVFEWVKSELLASNSLAHFIVHNGGYAGFYTDMRTQRAYAKSQYVNEAATLEECQYNATLAAQAYDKVIASQLAGYAVPSMARQIDELVDFVEEHKIKNVFLIGGGTHNAWFRYLDLNTTVAEIMTPAISMFSGGVWTDVTASQVQSGPDNVTPFQPGLYQGYNAITVDPKEKTLTLEMVHADRAQGSMTIKLE